MVEREQIVAQDFNSLEALAMPTYTPQHVANFFLDAAGSNDAEFTQLQLQKLVYIAQGWSAAILNKPLFDENIEAWQHGPVIPSLYHEFKSFGRDPITRKAVRIDYDEDTLEMTSEEPYICPEDRETLAVLSLVYDIYGDLHGNKLRGLTHEPGTPWSLTSSKSGLFSIIPLDLIRVHMAEVVNKIIDTIKSASPEGVKNTV